MKIPFINFDQQNDLIRNEVLESIKKIFDSKNYVLGSNVSKFETNYSEINIDERLLVGIITPDKDIIPDAKNLKPAYLVFNNYELILKWNRSLRFALAVCTLKEKISNEL